MKIQARVVASAPVGLLIAAGLGAAKEQRIIARSTTAGTRGSGATS